MDCSVAEMMNGPPDAPTAIFSPVGEVRMVGDIDESGIANGLTEFASDPTSP